MVFYSLDKIQVGLWLNNSIEYCYFCGVGKVC